MEENGSFKTPEKLCSDNQWNNKAHNFVGLQNVPKLIGRQPQVQPRRLLGADLDTVTAQDTVLVGAYGKGPLHHGTGVDIFVAGIAAMVRTVIVADIGVCAEFKDGTA